MSPTARIAPLTHTEINQLDTPELARLIDHTLLSPTASANDIRTLCSQATQLGTYAVCISPVWVALAAQELAGSETAVCTVIGFPHGATTTEAKIAEARQAIDDGADELDMVIHQAAALSGDEIALRNDISAVVAQGATTKVILETAALPDEAIITAATAAVEAGANYVKTSTGFGPGGATEHAVSLLRTTVGDTLGVKASGGVRTREDAVTFLRAGATRLGASSTLDILGITTLTNTKD